MTISLPCSYLSGSVELTLDRWRHIAERHPDLASAGEQLIYQTLAEPETVIRSRRTANARLISRWYNDLNGGMYVVVVVISDDRPIRHWIITAYLTRRLSPGVAEWKKT